jgi:hypothetical protein
MKYITKRYKDKITRLYQHAKKSGVNITHQRTMSKVNNAVKYYKKLARKEGTYLHWPDSVFDGVMLMVSVRTKYTGREVGLKIYLSKNEIPQPFQRFWIESDK